MNALQIRDLLEFERQCWGRGFLRVAGVDEAGRGPWAGPVVAACVVLPFPVSGWEGLDDSKKLSPSRREYWFARLHESGSDIGVGLADAMTVDRINILQATFLAMRRAWEALKTPPDFLLIDGNQCPPSDVKVSPIVKGDSRSLSIAAASVIAKVTRDRLMDGYAALFPQWGFERHKGYGTAMHLQAIRTHGLCELHRRSYAPIREFSLKNHPA